MRRVQRGLPHLRADPAVHRESRPGAARPTVAPGRAPDRGRARPRAGAPGGRRRRRARGPRVRPHARQSRGPRRRRLGARDGCRRRAGHGRGGPASPGLARVARLLPRRAARGWGHAAPRRGSHRHGSARRATRSSSRAAPKRCCRSSATPGFASTLLRGSRRGPRAAARRGAPRRRGRRIRMVALRQRRGAGRRRRGRADHAGHSRRGPRHGHPGREPHPASPAARRASGSTSAR